MNPTRDGARAIARWVSPIRDRAAEALGRLAPRERLLVMGAGAVALLLLVWLGAVEPLGASLAQLDREVKRSRDDTASIGELVGRYRALRAEVDRLERSATSEQGGASLFAQLESIAVPIAGRERIVAMNPSTRAAGNELQQELVEMRLEGVTMRSLVSLLYSIESREPPITVERLAVKRQYKDPSRVDAVVVVGRLRPQ